MTDGEQREAARQFVNKWRGRGNEDEDGRSYWIDLLQNVLGTRNVTDRIDFEKKVYVDGNKKRIDAYIPETRVLIEQKSLGKKLDVKARNSDGQELTPFEQAKRYSDSLNDDERARWIITCNFAEIWIYDMNQINVKEIEPQKIGLDELQTKYKLLDFLVNKEVKKLSEEMELSLQAGELVGKIHDRFLKQYNDPLAKRTQASLNVLCVRLVFCLYAEDAGLFGAKDAFSRYIAQYEPKDIRQALISLFKVLDTPYEERADLYLSDELAAFPYCNGGLFANENIVIPRITQDIKDTLAESAHFDWSKISPTIFGAVFESTLNPETRRAGGMHYTSIENIHKVIDPLFFDDLKAELADIEKIQVKNTRNRKLHQFQDKLASLQFLDPACGSGNFLTETYLSLRRLENQVVRDLTGGQMVLGEALDPIKVSIAQFYGIEINDFAVTVARTALWIAESQMMKETEEIIVQHLDFLPLKTNAHIVEGNALLIDWNSVVPAGQLNYIMGNPPFVGASMCTAEQKQEIVDIVGKIKLSNSLDYVAGWYYKAAKYIQNTNISTCFVSTNSITQGEQVAPMWTGLLKNYGVTIQFAHRTFIWSSEANEKAHVHCVIIGFSCAHSGKPKTIYEGQNAITNCKNISPYLIDSPNIIVQSRSTPISDVPAMVLGNKPADGGNLILSPEEKDDILSKEPGLKKYIRQYTGSVEFINHKERYCLWLVDATPKDLRDSRELQRRLNAVRQMRLGSSARPTREKAETPQLFFFISQPKSKYLLVPSTSSQRRRYVPIGFLPPDIIASNSATIVPDATLYHFGVMVSNVHMSWLRTVGGRLKSDYRYSNSVVYNTFPWPSPTDEQKSRIEQTAQGILDARALYPDSSLADLYDPLTMPPELQKAHTANDIAVMKAYGFSTKMSEADCVAELMKMYQALTKN